MMKLAEVKKKLVDNRPAAYVAIFGSVCIFAVLSAAIWLPAVKAGANSTSYTLRDAYNLMRLHRNIAEVSGAKLPGMGDAVATLAVAAIEREILATKQVSVV